MPPSLTSISGYSYGKATISEKSYGALAGNAVTCLKKQTALHTQIQDPDLLIMLLKYR